MAVKIDLSSVPTSELHEELAKREGVREMIVSPDSVPVTIRYIRETGKYAGSLGQIEVSGPARILINED